MAGDVSPAQWWRGVRNQRGKNCCRAWSRAGPCALWDSYPPPVSPFTLGATDAPPRPHLLSSALNLWIFWWGAKTQHGTMAGPQKGPDSQNVCTQGSQRRNRKMGGGSVCNPVQSLLLSWAHTARTVWFRQDWSHPHLAQSCLDSHPGPPKTAFINSAAKLKSEASFCYSPWASCGAWGRCHIYDSFIAGN